MAIKAMHFSFVLSDEVKRGNKLDVNLDTIFTATQYKANDVFVKVTWGEDNSAIYEKKAVEEFIQKGNWIVLH